MSPIACFIILHVGTGQREYYRFTQYGQPDIHWYIRDLSSGVDCLYLIRWRERHDLSSSNQAMHAIPLSSASDMFIFSVDMDSPPGLSSFLDWKSSKLIHIPPISPHVVSFYEFGTFLAHLECIYILPFGQKIWNLSNPNYLSHKASIL